MAIKLVRFDWAIKKLLRHKANFAILEGFLTELLKFEVTIENILESEGNKQEADDKYNRVDILVKSSDGELMLVEVQNESQVDYFQRMIYGVSKLITEYIKEGEPYSTIKKVYSINIVYFDLGQGQDYVYKYDGRFIGIHYKDELEPTIKQQYSFDIKKIGDIFPQYYVLKVNNFNDVAKDTLDEWIYFLKNSEVKENFRAKGLQEAGEKLRRDSLSIAEREAYDRFQKNRRIERSVIETAIDEAVDKAVEEAVEKATGKALKKGKKEGVKKEKARRDKELVLRLHSKNYSIEQITDLADLSVERVTEIMKQH